MNSTKVLGVNTECIPILFRQRRPGRLCIYLVKKYSGAAVEDMYLGYMIKMTRQTHGGVGIGPYYNKMVAKYPLKIEY
jgi:hypothetical protein